MKKEDYCHICGKKQKMSYEHIPPHSAFNNIPRKMVSIDVLDMNVENNWDVEGHRYKSFQRGFGFYSLCEKCNNTTGDLYGKEYVRVTNLVGNSILKIPQETRETSGTYAVVDIEEIDCRAFFKQVLSMFCSLNSIRFGTQFKEYLLSSDNVEFDLEKYKLCIYLHSGTMDRVNCFCRLLNPVSKEVTECSEISMFPFGFILYNLERSITNTFWGKDITDWGVKNGEKEKLSLDIPFLRCATGKSLEFT